MCNNFTFGFEGIDVDISWGDVDLGDLDQQTVIVTGLSQYTEEEGVGLVASAQIHMPFKKIIIYDLGLQKRTLQRVSRVNDNNIEVLYSALIYQQGTQGT